ncbi:MAG: hypothetical protein C4518_11445 [Desulfobacteraceae bacterium]|nr:MAG: hypothetical protein C4518_11445 [Desulfobacteraceae bacterium]
MMRQCKNRKSIFSLILLILMGFCAASVCLAVENGDTSLNDTTPRIKEIPGIETEGTRDFVKEVEKQYDFIGTVDSVQNEGLVIDDSFFKKAPGASISGASEGARVGLVLNSDGEVVLCESVKKVRR